MREQKTQVLIVLPAASQGGLNTAMPGNLLEARRAEFFDHIWNHVENPFQAQNTPEERD